LANRSLIAYAGILGILAAGRGYVPLNPKFPLLRTANMLERSGASVIIVDDDCGRSIEDLLRNAQSSLVVLHPKGFPVSRVSAGSCRHKFVELSADPSTTILDSSCSARPHDTAYLLFTSGTTGEPKGISVTHENVNSYLAFVNRHFTFSDDDRFSQTFDLTFDLSVHDMFVCWSSGASLWPVPDNARFAPHLFINDNKLTVWFSVPSVIGFMEKLQLLQRNAFGSLTFSLFCGAPLLATAAQHWQTAAPNSAIHNLYGPTEATIAISCFRWSSDDCCDNYVAGVVPIGRVFETQDYKVVDSARNEVAPGEVGELCVSGSQVTGGYLDDAKQSADKFVRLPGGGDRLWYRTGDRVSVDKSGHLHFVGRIDDQVQVRGHRVELAEVDHVLRHVLGVPEAISVAWPSDDPSATEIYAFFRADARVDVDQARRECKCRLPAYMVPRRFFELGEIPLNANGKFDRNRLMAYMEGLTSGTKC
jgi:amino acid adenylation domain-containing protein